MPRNAHAATNPFIYARPLAPGEAIARESEVEALLARAEGGHAVTLHAARRLGKTSLLKQLAEAADRIGLPTVLVDLSDVLSVADVAVRLEQAYRSLPGGLGRLAARELGSLGVTMPLVGVSVGRRADPREPISSVHSLLEVPARIAERRRARVLVIFDEFQALIDLRGLDGLFRSHLQHHERVSYLFCGSEPSLLRALFEDRSRPLYGQAESVRLGRPAYAAAHDFIVERFAATGKDVSAVAVELVQLSELHPQRLMLLAHHVWAQIGTSPATMSDLRTAYDVGLRSVEPELRYLWDGLSANERRVLVAVSSRISPYSAEARALAGLRSASSAQRAATALVDRGILERRGSATLLIVDPLFARWVRRTSGARLAIYVVPDASGNYIVTDGPSLAFERSKHADLDDARHEADRLAASGRGADVMVYDTDDPNDLPGWVRSRS